MQFWGFLFYQKITFGPIWGSGPKKRVQNGPPWSQRVPHWAQRVPLVPEGPYRGPYGPMGAQREKKTVFFPLGRAPPSKVQIEPDIKDHAGYRLTPM